MLLALRLLRARDQKDAVERCAEILCGLQAHTQMGYVYLISNDLPADAHVAERLKVMLAIPSLKP